MNDEDIWNWVKKIRIKTIKDVSLSTSTCYYYKFAKVPYLLQVSEELEKALQINSTERIFTNVTDKTLKIAKLLKAMWIVKDAAKAASVRHLNLNFVSRRLPSALSHNNDDSKPLNWKRFPLSSSSSASSAAVFEGNCIRSKGESCNMCLMRRSPLQKLFYYRRY